MRPMIDFFPETPAGFHLRVEETLTGLEENDMKNVKVYSRRVIALAIAAMIFIFAATAVAVVQGDALRSKMTASGGDEFAAMVQDVHVADGNDDFSFTIDEILWQGEDMYVSYTASVPEDGNVYLFSPYEVRMSGSGIEHGRDVYHNGLDAEFFTCLYALGGEYGSSVSQIMKLRVEDAQTSGKFDCKCVFMKTDRPLEKLDSESYHALFTEPDAQGNANQLMKSANVLYYFDTTVEGDPVPVVYLFQYPEVRALIDADENSRVTPQKLEETGIAKMVGMQEISIDVQESEGAAPVYNDAEQRTFDMGDYSLELTELYISHFETRFAAVIRKPDGIADEWTPDEPYGQYYSLCNADGSEFGTETNWSMGGGESVVLSGGEKVYRVDGFSEGIYPLENLEEIYLAPAIFDEESGEFVNYDMTRAIKLNPSYNPSLPAPTQQPDPAETDDLSN